MATVTEPTQHVTPNAPRQLSAIPYRASDNFKAAAMLSTDDLQRLTDGKRVRDIVRHIRAILEQGDRLAGMGNDWIHSLTDDDRNALRFLRRQLIERDLYQQLYGDLPFTVSDDGEVQS